ncbi:MAG: hypothetical protein G01um10148_736 [Parcubacteria group bacterium Gr01-1014_8]|nr:MAG: hypothetical protein G01um10148_736 [Parcubacteria group bacterium Gr01-1014_8]
MKNYMAVFLGSPDRMKNWKPNEATMKEGMEQWSKWATDHKGDIVDMGSPLGKTKRVDKNGISDTSNEMGAWTIVQAESQEEAAKLFINHPHFTIFPGERVEVMECLPMPKM